jgi:invasion protein IalB
MSKPDDEGSGAPDSSRGGHSIGWMSAVLGAILGLALAGTAGFYIGKNQVVVDKSPVGATARPPAPQLPAGVTRLPVQKFGSWNLTCLQNLQKQKKCELVLRAMDRTRKALVLSLAVARNAKGEALLVVVTPPSVAFAAGVRLVPGTSPEMKVGFATCAPGACQAIVGLSDSVVAALSSAEVLQVSYVAGTGRPVNYKLPITGFSQGFAAWRAN